MNSITLQQRDRWEWPLWVGFLVAALAARLATIRYESFWHDEIFTRGLMLQSWGEMNRAMAADVHPPLYFWQLWLWTRVFGVSETALRLPSALCAWATIAVFAAWMRVRVSPKAGWVAGCILLFHPMVISQSIFARMYPLESLLTAGLLAVAGELLRPDLRRIRTAAWGFGVLNLMLVSVQYLSLLLILPASLALGSLLVYAERGKEDWAGGGPRRRLLWLAIACAVCGAISAAWLGPLAAGHIQRVSGSIWIEQVWGEGFSIRLLARNLFEVLGVRTQEGFALLPLAGLALTPLLAGWTGWVAMRGEDIYRRRLGVLLVAALAGMLVAGLGVSLARTTLQGRYLFPAAVVLAGIVGMAAENMRGMRARSLPVYGYGLLILSTGLGYLGGNRIIERWNVAMPAAAGELRAGDALIFVPAGQMGNFEYFVPQWRDTGAVLENLPDHFSPGYPKNVEAELSAAIPKYSRLVLFLQYENLFDPQQAIRKTLQARGISFEERILPGRNWKLMIIEGDRPAGA